MILPIERLTGEQVFLFGVLSFEMCKVTVDAYV